MKKSTKWSKLAGLAMILAICTLGVSADEPQPAQATEPEAAAAAATSDVKCVPPDASTPLFTTVLDRVRQDSCSCRDQCFSDFQCVQQNGPGSTCEPVGPCGCKECVSTS